MHNHIAFVLDRSGSMAKHKFEVTFKYNTQVRIIGDSLSNNIDVSLVTFSDYPAEDFFLLPKNTLKVLNFSHYHPLGGSAYYDAIGHTVSRLKETTNNNDRYLVIAISDGKDTSSQIWTKNLIENQVKELKKASWNFILDGLLGNTPQMLEAWLKWVALHN